jgi:hypothetical protein
MDSADQYLVMLTTPRRPTLDEADALARTVAEVRAQPLADALQAVSHGQGIMAEGLRLEEATAIVQAAQMAGFDAVWKSMAAIVPLPPAVPMIGATFSDAGWTPRLPRVDQPDEIPWEGLLAMGAGEVHERVVEDEETDRGFLDARILTVPMRPSLVHSIGWWPIGDSGDVLGGGSTRIREKITVVHVLDLVTPDRRFRIDSDRFDYGGIGGKLAPTCTQNFMRLIDFLAARAPTARHNFVTPDPEALIPKRWELFRAEKEFDARLLWLLQTAGR